MSLVRVASREETLSDTSKNTPDCNHETVKRYGFERITYAREKYWKCRECERRFVPHNPDRDKLARELAEQAQRLGFRLVQDDFLAENLQEAGADLEMNARQLLKLYAEEK